jgi:hypothetical protein
VTSATPYIAGYAAVLSTWVAGRAVARDRPRLRLSVIFNVHAVADGDDGEYASRESMGVTVHNVGDRFVELRGVGLQTWESDNLHPVWADWVAGNNPSDALPRGLKPGETASFYFVQPERDVIGAFCFDTSGRFYRAKRFEWRNEFLRRWYGLIRRIGIRPAVYTAKLNERRRKREVATAKRLGLPYYDPDAD